MGTINCSLWGLYGLLKFDAIDYKLFLPNAFGTCIFLLQISIWIYYYKKSKKDVNNKIDSSSSTNCDTPHSTSDVLETKLIVED